MRVISILCGIAISGAVLMGGPVVAGQTKIDCTNAIKTDSHEVSCGPLSRPVNVEVDTKTRMINPFWTLPRTASSNQKLSINRSLPVKVRELIDTASEKLGLDPALVRAVAMTESSGNQGAVSRVGAVGVMQLMPGTARGLGVNPYDLEQNILGGAMYLKRQLEKYQGNIQLALAAYNAGPGAVDKYRGVPPFRETREYIARVINAMGRV